MTNPEQRKGVLIKKKITKSAAKNAGSDESLCAVLARFTIGKVFNKVIERVTLKAPITTASDDIHKYFFIVSKRK